MWKPKKKIVEEVEEEIPEIEEEIEDEEEEIEVPKQTKFTKEIGSKVWSVQEVPTESVKVIYNSRTKKSYDLFSAVVEILNRIED